MRFFGAASLFVAANAAALFASASPIDKRANTGEFTFYTPGLGACGIQSAEGQLVAAVSEQFFNTYPGAGPNPNLNPVCGKQLQATYQGKSVTVTVVDKCPTVGCVNLYDVDVSQAAFTQLADPAVGRITGVEWSIL